MTAIADSTAIRDAIAAGQAKAATVPLREYTDTFQGFQDFDLDLTCLSPPASPPGSVYEDAHSSPRHSLSLSFRSASPTQSRRSKSKSAEPLNHSRGSWPLVRYVGRGTPIDKNRRIEWGATSTESDDGVAEDGFFTTTVRTASIDSTARSVEPDWNILTRRASTVPARSGSRALRAAAPADQPRPKPSPAIQIEGLGSEQPGEWASFMHTVLGSSPAPAAAASTSQAPAPAPSPAAEPAAHAQAHDAPQTPTMTPEQIQQLDAELGIDLGIDGALDLGLGCHGHEGWFGLPLPLPVSRGPTPSVYSSRAPTAMTTPRPSRPPSVAVTLRDNRSAVSGKGGGGDVGQPKMKTGKSAAPMWWRRMMQGLKKVPLLMIGSR